MTMSSFVQTALILTLSLLPAAAQDAAKTPDANSTPAQPAATSPAAAQPAAAKPAAPKTAAKRKPQAAPRKSYSIFDYQKELGMTDDQIAQVKAAVKTLQDALIAKKNTAEQVQGELRQLLQSNADIEPIRAKLQVLAGLEVDRQIADIEASRSVSKIMTPEQREKWHAIQARMSGDARGQSPSAPKQTP
jgi:Spy/CpxP family protein refolding chaperone